MKKVDLYFLMLATVMLLVGVTLGIMMGASQDFQLMPVHAHINLVGWASLALFGLTYRAYPELASRKLAAAHLILSASAALAFPVGIYLAIAHGIEAVVIASAVAWLAGAAIFLLQLLTLVIARMGSATAVAAK